MSNERILVVIKRVGCKPTAELVSPRLEALQAIVGGYIQAIGRLQIPAAPDGSIVDVQLYSNEETDELPPNFVHPSGDVIAGDVVWIAADKCGNEISIPDDVLPSVLAFTEAFSPQTDAEEVAS